MLKIKLAMAIIGISSIHLLRTFLYAGQLGKENALYTETGVMWQAIIHGMFVLSAIGIALVEWISQPVISGALPTSQSTEDKLLPSSLRKVSSWHD